MGQQGLILEVYMSWTPTPAKLLHVPLLCNPTYTRCCALLPTTLLPNKHCSLSAHLDNLPPRHTCHCAQTARPC